MTKSILRDLVILLVIFGFIWGITLFFPVFPEKVELLSIGKEQEMGDAYMKLLLKSPDFNELESEYIDSVVHHIGDHLKSALEESEYDYNFVVIDDPMINAFALPGGHIVVTTGLLNFIDSAEELAAVIAHEMGHAEMRHVVTRLAKELGLTILTSGDQFVMGEVTRIITSTGFDRSQESDADQFSFELLEKAGIEPRILATFFRKLKDEQGSELLEKFEIVSTHPNFTNRIRMALEYVPSDSFIEVPLEIDWKEVTSRLPQ
jgi:predicted Zn-dependent protease